MFDLILDKQLFEDYFLNDRLEKLELLPKTNSINIIIGTNNSGKSRFIRNLMAQKNYDCYKDYKKHVENIESYNKTVELINSGIEFHMDNFHKRSAWSTINGRDPEKERADRINSSRLSKLNVKIPNEIISIFNTNISLISSLKSSRLDVFNLDDFKAFNPNFFENASEYNRYYIPTLRTAHSLFKTNDEILIDAEEGSSLPRFEKIEKDIFLHTYKKNYKLDKKIRTFTGLHLYREILNTRNSKRETRKKFEDFENFVGNHFFNGKKIDIVAEFNKEKSLNNENESENIIIYIDGEKETRYLYDLGDGIQALIILMYQIYMAENDSVIFIDEPELHLHPGMQRLFLEQISTNKYLEKKNLKYFITTHSNHFLDLTIEKNNVSIYAFTGFVDDKGENKFIIRNVNDGDNKVLKDLGVNNSSVFLANSSIWVEGISDRNYIKAFLKSYLNGTNKPYSLKEDIDFAFFEYAGSNIEHYLFSDEVDDSTKELVLSDINSFSLNNRIFLIADSDNSDKRTKKGKRLTAFEEQKKDNFFPKIIWNIREIENLLTDDIWKEILIEFCEKTLVEKNRELVQQKIDDAVIEIRCKDYSTQYIGNYLNAIREKLGKIENKYILNKSTYITNSDGNFGTLVNKRYLSEIVFNKEFDWEVFSKSEDIKGLTEDIYKFIK